MNFTDVFTREKKEVYLGDVYNIVYKRDNLIINFELHKHYIIIDYGIMLENYEDVYIEFWYEPWKISEEEKKEYDSYWEKAYTSKLTIYTDEFLNKVINYRGINKLTQQLLIKLFSTR